MSTKQLMGGPWQKEQLQWQAVSWPSLADEAWLMSSTPFSRMSALRRVSGSPAVRGSVVVTGCGMGIGRAVLERVLLDGYYVVGVELDASAAQEVEEIVKEAGSIVVGDAADRSTLDEAAERAARARPLFGWVNNASLVAESNLHEPVPEVVEKVFALNIAGYYWGCATAIQMFVRQRSRGAIVNVSSVHGRVSYSGHAAYDASKGAVDALTRYIAVEYGPVGIRATGIAPGAVRTPGSEKAIAASADPERLERDIARQNPLRRFAEPLEIACVAAFLLSDEASFITGQTIAVDGGLTAACMLFETDATLRALYESLERPVL